MASLAAGDFIAFYASLRPVDRAGWLVYALIGFLTVGVVRASEVRNPDWHRNAHTRRAQVSPDDVVVFGAAGASAARARHPDRRVSQLRVPRAPRSPQGVGRADHG